MATPAARPVQPQPLIAVRDVAASSRWYQAVLGLTSAHGGDEYDRIGRGDEFLLQLHHWDAHQHPGLGDETNPSRGNGVLLWFAVADFDAALKRVAGAGAEVIDGPLVNPAARHREVWVRDPDGYVVVLAGPPADVG
jgi:catechol 2,3-dioxygenase-like lactoylglutathione lyase family enzyme